MLIFKRLRRGPDGQTLRSPYYSFKFTHQGKQYLRATKFERKDLAEKAAKALLHSLEAGRFDLAETSKLRASPSTVAIRQLLAIYQASAAALEIKPRTAANNTSSLRLILHRCGHAESEPVTALNADLVHHWKTLALAAIQDQDPSPESAARAQQLKRSANSTLRQARSILSAQALAHYRREHQLDITRATAGFLSEPMFQSTGKLDYNPPSDHILAQTFHQLEHLRPGAPSCADTMPGQESAPDRNLYLAVWLALGFGLRKSEIAQARLDWFTTRSGRIHLSSQYISKNRQRPDIACQLGAWAHIAPLITGRQPDSYILDGPATERGELVVRRLSAWMRRLGWRTQKTLHEFRAYAGSQIAQSQGIYAAKEFLRHSSVQITERYYMRFLKTNISEVLLTLPDQAPSPIAILK